MNAHNRPKETSSEPQPPCVPAQEQRAGSPETGPGSESPHQIKIAKTIVPREGQGAAVVAEVFTLTLGPETIQLLPLKNWAQLDVFKWKARGILPRTPAGLEIALDHVKVAGETVSTWDPEACAKLEKAFNDWLALERQNLELATAKAQTPKAQTTINPPEEDVLRFEVEIDKAGKGHIKCLEGNETVKTVALNQQGLNALIEQGFMRKPRAFKVGALHDWVELDGELIRFHKDTNWNRQLEKLLNDRYLWRPEPGAPPDVVVFPNPASPTGFDIQFPATPNGLAENRRNHLNEESVELLQDPQKCRVLRKGTIAKLMPPNLIFKRKTADGGERCLKATPENTVFTTSDNGQVKTIDLSQPVNLLTLNAAELSAVLNHPAINRRAKLAHTSVGEMPSAR